MKPKKRFALRHKIYQYQAYKEKIMNEYIVLEELENTDKQAFITSFLVMNRFGWYDMKKYGLSYEPDLKFIEEKLKDTIKEPFIKMQSFYKIYGNINGHKINMEECLREFPMYFKKFDEFLLWTFYGPITLHAILGRFTFYMKNQADYYDDLKETITKTVFFDIFFEIC